MKTRLWTWLGIVPTCLMTFVTAERQTTAEPTGDSRLLVEPAQLQNKLNDPSIRILDVRAANEYRKGHIPGAVSVDISDWKALATADGGLYDAMGWTDKIGPLGIAPRSHVLVYGGRLSDAARVWWLLKYVGVENASLLNGSWETWMDSDRPVETSMPKVTGTQFKPRFQTDRLEQMDSLKNALKSDKVNVVDTRSDSEFAGGRIPGSTHLEWKELVAEDGRFKTKTQLQQLFRDRGVVPDETAVCY